MKAYLDIENSKTNQVITVEVPVVTFDLQKQVVFDIKNIGEQDFNLILNAILIGVNSYHLIKDKK